MTDRDSNLVFILVRKDGTLDGVPSFLERWRESMNEFIATRSDDLAAIDPSHVCFIRAHLVEVEEPVLIMSLCSTPPWRVKSYKLIGAHA